MVAILLSVRIFQLIVFLLCILTTQTSVIGVRFKSIACPFHL